MNYNVWHWCFKYFNLFCSRLLSIWCAALTEKVWDMQQGYSWWMGVSCSKHFQYSDQFITTSPEVTAPKWLQIWMWVWVRIAQTSWKVGWYKSYHAKMLNVTLKWYDETTHHTVYIPVVDVAPSLRFWRQRHVVSLKCPVVRCCWETPMVYASQCERPSNCLVRMMHVKEFRCYPCCVEDIKSTFWIVCIDVYITCTYVYDSPDV